MKKSRDDYVFHIHRKGVFLNVEKRLRCSCLFLNKWGAKIPVLSSDFLRTSWSQTQAALVYAFQPWQDYCWKPSCHFNMIGDPHFRWLNFLLKLHWAYPAFPQVYFHDFKINRDWTRYPITDCPGLVRKWCCCPLQMAKKYSEINFEKKNVCWLMVHIFVMSARYAFIA